MKLKTFRVADMAEAMQLIKDDIGPDAVILSSRQVRPKKGMAGLFKKKEIEVIAGYDEEEAAKPGSFKASLEKPYTPARGNRPEPPAPTSAPTSATQEDTFMRESIGELKGMIETLAQQVNSTSAEIPAEKRYSQEIMALYRQMVQNDVDEEIADEICQRIQDVCAVRSVDAKEVAESMMLDMIGTPRLIESTKYKQRVVMLIGPTGVGKTTTLIKLAYMLIYKKKLNIGIINADSFRVAAQEHLKAYCEILKTDLITIYKPEEIKEALAAFKDKDIVLVDTAGKVSDDNEYRMDIAKLCALGKIGEIYITLGASTAGRVLKKTIENYSFLKKYAVIITKADEIATKGMMLSVSKFSQMPLSYMTAGQNVPDDIRVVSPQEIVKSILESN